MRKISWLFLLTVFLSFYLHSCRSEDFLQDQPDGEEKYKVSILNKEQVHQQESLVKEIKEIKSKFRYKANVTAKTVQNEILDGAIIGTDQVLLIERNGAKTYTFPVSRTYISDKSESLVVKENADHTYSGILIQYDLTKEQRQQFISGQLTDIKSKVKIYDIDKLNIASRLQTDVVGCYKIVWETGWCSAHVHQSGQSGCTVGGAPAPFIQSVENICENGTPDDGGVSGGNDGSPTGPGTGGVSLDLGAYFTIPFISIGHQYYETEDDLDPNYIHYTQVANFFSLLGTEINQLRVANPDLFYYTFYYFKDNGINPTTKAFITQRLVGLNNWYNLANNAPDNIPANNQYFLNWAFEYLVMNPDITWQEFYDQYLATPCEKTKPAIDKANAILKNPTVNAQMDAILKGKADAPNEWAVAVGLDIATGNYMVEGPNEGTPTTSNFPSANLGDKYIASGHSHAKKRGSPSVLDLYSTLQLSQVNYLNYRQSYVYGINNGSVEVYALVVTDKDLAGTFLSSFPKSENYDDATHWFKRGTKLYEDVSKIMILYKNNNITNNSGESHNDYALALAYILEKHNTGISLAKADTNGNLKKVNASIEPTITNGFPDEKIAVSKCP